MAAGLTAAGGKFLFSIIDDVFDGFSGSLAELAFFCVAVAAALVVVVVLLVSLFKPFLNERRYRRELGERAGTLDFELEQLQREHDAQWIRDNETARSGQDAGAAEADAGRGRGGYSTNQTALMMFALLASFLAVVTLVSGICFFTGDSVLGTDSSRAELAGSVGNSLREAMLFYSQLEGVFLTVLGVAGLAAGIFGVRAARGAAVVPVLACAAVAVVAGAAAIGACVALGQAYITAPSSTLAVVTGFAGIVANGGLLVSACRVRKER